MFRTLVSIFAVAALTPIASSAIAQDGPASAAPAPAPPVTPKVGQVVRDANGRRLGPITSIQNGAASLILDMRMYRIPVTTLSMTQKGLMTSLSLTDLRKTSDPR